MNQRLTCRVPDTLYEFLQIEADARQCGVSDLIRAGLEHVLGLTSDQETEPSKAPQPAPLSPPHDCTERLLAWLPPDVREDILARARYFDLPVSKVVTSLLIMQLPPTQPSPQVSETARPQTAFVRWRALRQQGQQSAEAALPIVVP